MEDKILKIKILFDSKLQTKTGWGRNEVSELLQECINEVLYVQNKLF